MKEKNELFVPTDNQRNPGLCKAEDWKILRDDDSIFHGQRSDEIQKQSDAECGRGKFAGTPDRNNVDSANNVLGGDGRRSRK